MANPTVEKLKEVGLKYGDKAAVAITSLLFFVCLGAAAWRKSIDITPDEIKKAAEAADSNINRRQERDDIVKILESGGIKPTNFAQQAEDTAKTVLVADNYAPDREWVTPEPGAGLIRDTPVLIAPTELYAYPGRGGALVYALDEQGNRIVDTEKKEIPKEAPRRRRRRRGGMSAMGGMGMGMAQNAGRRGSRKSQAEMEREQREEYEQRKREMAARLAGRDEAPKEKDETEKAEVPAAQGPPMKEIVKALRWVAITGVLDHGKLVANYREALKNPAVAHPHYARLDLQRQARQNDESWSEWEDVNAEENLAILDNLPEWDEDLVPDNALPNNLNDPLPFLKAGLWEKVHIGSLVPKEKKEVAAPATAGGMGPGGMMGGYAAMMRGGSGGMGGYGGSGGMGGYAAMMRGGGGGMGGGYAAMMRGGSGGMGGGYAAMMRGGSGGMMGGYGGMMGGGETNVNYWKSEEKRVMIRGLDFTARSDNTYRYRVRIVVFNPNYKRDDVNHDVDTKATELFGPWSEATDEVNMPADVEPYAMDTVPASGKSDLKVKFQVVRFDPTTGWTVTRNFESGPGEVIGEVRSTDTPSSEGTNKKTIPVDFFSRQIVLDADGGLQSLPSGIPGGSINRPALALLLRPDGTVLARTQVDDVTNEVRKDIERNYALELKESSKKRENSLGSGYGGMMGGYGGMMGGGYGGMMMGGGGRR